MSHYEPLSSVPSPEVRSETTIVVYSFGIEHGSPFEAALMACKNAEL